MKAIQMTEVGGPEVMKYTEVEAPEPGPGQAQVSIKAAGVNYTDVYSRSGVNHPAKMPAIPGIEAAGVVTKLGEGVTEVVLPEIPAGPITIDLPGGTLLTVRVRTTGGAVPARLGLVVEAEARLLEGPKEAGDRLYARAGASIAVSSEWGDERCSYTFLFREDGTLRIAGVRPGVAFRLTVLDRIADRRLETRELKLGSRERRCVGRGSSVDSRVEWEWFEL